MSPVRFSPWFPVAAGALDLLVVLGWNTAWRGPLLILLAIILMAWLFRAGPEVVGQLRAAGALLAGQPAAKRS
jgi:hypothetical protein